MTRRRSPLGRRRPDGPSLVWGLLFALVAALGIARAAGVAIDWPLVTLLAPVALILLGVLGLALHRRP